MHLSFATRPLRAAALGLALVLLAAPDGTPPSAGAWSPPVPGRVVAPFQRPPERWLAGHRGLDLRGRPFDAVRAPRDGVVTFTGVVVDRPVLVVTHADGTRSTLEPVLATAAVGTSVERGDVVGRVGEHPGHCAPDTCLHWGVRVGDDYLDPALLLADVRIVLLPLRGGGQAFSLATRSARSRAMAAVCIWEIRDSVTPSTVPISESVMFSK